MLDSYRHHMLSQSMTMQTSQKGSKKKFTPEEDARLKMIVEQLGESNWKRVADQMGTRNYRQCRERWKNYLCPNVCRDPWSPEEDILLQQKYSEYGSQWSVIAKFFQNRTDVGLKNRWVVLTAHTDQTKRVRRSGHRRKPSEAPNSPQDSAVDMSSSKDDFSNDYSVFDDDLEYLFDSDNRF